MIGQRGLKTLIPIPRRAGRKRARPHWRIVLVPELSADNFARHDDFNAPVFLAARSSAIISNGHGLPESLRRYAIALEALRDQEITNRIPPLPGESLVEFVTASAVGVTFHLEIQPRMRQDNAGELGQLFPGARPYVVFPGIEENVGHSNNKSARRVSRFQDSIKLFQQLGTKLFGRPLG